MGKYVTAAEAVQVVKSGDRVYVQAAAATPTILTKALTDRASELRNVELCHLHTEGDAPYANPELAESFHVNSFFIGANVRHTLKAGNGSYTPVFLSELPLLFRKNVVKLDHYYHPDELTEALNKFVENYNNCRCHEALNNLTPSDVYFGRADKILEQRAIIKQQTIAKRRQLYYQEKIINL